MNDSIPELTIRAVGTMAVDLASGVTTSRCLGDKGFLDIDRLPMLVGRVQVEAKEYILDSDKVWTSTKKLLKTISPNDKFFFVLDAEAGQKKKVFSCGTEISTSELIVTPPLPEAATEPPKINGEETMPAEPVILSAPEPLPTAPEVAATETAPCPEGSPAGSAMSPDDQSPSPNPK